LISMNSGELPLKTRRNVIFASQSAGAGSAELAIKQAAPIVSKNRQEKVLIITSANRSLSRLDAWLRGTRCAAPSKRSPSTGGLRIRFKRPRPGKFRFPRQPEASPHPLHLQVAQGQRQSVGSVRRLGSGIHREQIGRASCRERVEGSVGA